MADAFPTAQNFYDANDDLRTIDAVSNSKDPDTGADIDTWNTRRGGPTDTLAGRLDKLGVYLYADWPGAGDPDVTLTNVGQSLRWQLADGGDGHDYGWTGAFPKTVSAGDTPTPLGAGGWVDRSDLTFQSTLAGAGGSLLVGDNGRTVADAIAQQGRGRYLYLDGTAACGLSPRIPAFGTGNFSFAARFELSALGKGIVGGITGSFAVRTTSAGAIVVSSVSVADVATTPDNVVSAGVSHLIQVIRSSGVLEIVVDGVTKYSQANSTNFTGDIAFVGSADGISSFASGKFFELYINNAAMTKITESVSAISYAIPNTISSLAYFDFADALCDLLVVYPSVRDPAYTQVTLVMPTAGAALSENKRNFKRSSTPRTGAGYFVGDSQTYGFNASGNPVYTDTANTRLLEQYRWPWIYSKSNNRDVTVNNLGVTGSGLAATSGAPVTDYAGWHPHLYAMGQISKSWTGQIVMMPAWNNIGGTGAILSASKLLRVRRGIEALIAKAVSVDYGGLGATGQYSVWGTVISGWATTGTSGDVTVSGLDNAANPFPSAGAPANNLIRKVTLAAGQYVEFTVLDVGPAGEYFIFTEANTAGSAYTIAINGSTVVTDTTLTSEAGLWPQVNRIHAPTVGQLIRVTNTGTGSVTFLAAAWAVSDTSNAVDREIIVGSTSGNLNGRLPENLQLAAKQAKAAAMAFADFGVRFADVACEWQAGDNDAQDADHISPQGNERLAAAFMQAELCAPKYPAWFKM